MIFPGFAHWVLLNSPSPILLLPGDFEPPGATAGVIAGIQALDESRVPSPSPSLLGGLELSA